MQPGPVDRANANDMMQLAVETDAVPMQVGAVLVLDGAGTTDVQSLTAVLAERAATVRRLRQRLVPTPFGCGRPIWIDDAGDLLARQVHVDACPAPHDMDALLAVATRIVATRLPGDRPPWSATFVTGLAGGRTGLVIVFNHVLADGIGGLAVLANLVDGLPLTKDPDFPRPPPDPRAVFLDATRQRIRALRPAAWRAAWHHLQAALAEARPGLRTRAPDTSFNRPTGTARRTRIVQTDLAAVVDAAHAHGATVNDVVLAAVGDAVHALLRSRGEDTDHIVVSIPVSARRSATSAQLGNEVGVMPVAIPITGGFDARIEQIARDTAARKGSGAARGSSAAITTPLFRAMARIGVLQWFINRQHIINTLVTNLRGPADRLAFAQHTILDVIPVSIVTGNVTVGFAVLSYAGALTITVNADADACPDLDVLVDALQRRLDGLRPATRPQLLPG